MKISSLSAIVLAAGLATGAKGQHIQSSSTMTQEQLRARVIELCGDPNFEKHLINPKNTVCEISSDNGKTWKEYIPNLPNGTVGIAGGLAGLLVAVGAGIAIIRYKKNNKKIVTREEFLSALREATKGDSKSKTNHSGKRTSQSTSVEEVSRALGAIEGVRSTEKFSLGSIPAIEQSPGELGDWDEVEKILAAEEALKNNTVIETPAVTEDREIEIIPVNDSIQEGVEIQENIGSSALVVGPERSDLDTTDHNKDNSTTYEEIKEKLQSTELSEEEKKDISKITLSILKMVKTNIEKRYGFKIDDIDGKILLTAIVEGARLFHLDDDQSIVEKQDFSTDGVAQFRRLGDGYFQIVFTNGKTKNIYLIKGDN